MRYGEKRYDDMRYGDMRYSYLLMRYGNMRYGNMRHSILQGGAQSYRLPYLTGHFAKMSPFVLISLSENAP